jgi:hypothetical protein
MGRLYSLVLAAGVSGEKAADYVELLAICLVATLREAVLAVRYGVCPQQSTEFKQTKQPRVSD